MSKEDFEGTFKSLLIYKSAIATAHSMNTSVALIISAIILIVLIFLTYNIFAKFIRTVKYKDKNFGRVIYIINNILIIIFLILVLSFMIKIVFDILTFTE